MAQRHSDEFKREAVRIALTSGLSRRQAASDLRVGFSTLVLRMDGPSRSSL